MDCNATSLDKLEELQESQSFCSQTTCRARVGRRHRAGHVQLRLTPHQLVARIQRPTKRGGRLLPRGLARELRVPVLPELSGRYLDGIVPVRSQLM